MRMSRVFAVTGLALLCVAIATVSSISAAFTMRYAQPDLQRVPVDQLIKNLSQLSKDKPKDLALKNNLARAHAMAFARNDEAVDFLTGEPEKGVWFGYEPRNLPFAQTEGEVGERREDAQQHLVQAIAIYEEILKADKSQLIARLGFAWCLEQADKKDQAIEQYRQVIAEAWEKEKELTQGGLGFHSIVAESAGYLIPLLDQHQDAAEIAELKSRAEKLEALPRPITPIAIPLSSGMTAEQMLDANASVRFDADGSGRKDTHWTWITPNAAWLVYNPKDSNAESFAPVTSALQLFGNVTFWMFWENGYQPMAALDKDGDGTLQGDELASLSLWHDANGNGVSEPSEVRPVTEFGIVALSCRSQSAAPAESQGTYAAWSAQGVTYADGTTRPTFDLILEQR